MKYLFTLFFAFAAITSFSQTTSIQSSPDLFEASAASVGMSEERLARIDSLFNGSIEDNYIPGAVALVARKGKVVYYKAFGSADNETGRSLKRDDIFRLASQTKAITATAVMMLWEEGKFRLDDPISKYIPEFEDAQILDTFSEEDTTYTTKPAEAPITIRHLLTHTSGIGYGVIDSDDRFTKIYEKAGIKDLYTTENISIEDNVKKLAKLPLHHNPGEKFTYSEGLDVLGYFIEVISGMPLNEFFRSRIFDPLGMDDTWFYLPESKHDRLVTVQTKEDGIWIKKPVTYYDPDYPIKGAKRFYSGGAGLSSTAEDYATFLQMYLNNGELNGQRFLSRTTVELILSNQEELEADSTRYFGLAFAVLNQVGKNTGGLGSQGTFHWGGLFHTFYFADPREELIGIIMTQVRDVDFHNIQLIFRQLVGQAIDD